MNKKFSTLLCASLLFSSAFSAVNAADLNNAAVGANATAVAKLDKAALSGVYQLRVGTQVLVIEDGKYVLKNVNDGFDLQASLWCVQVTEEGQGKEPIYDFVNKATGEFLAISEEDVVGLQVGEKTKSNLSVGETFGGWAFSPEYKENLKGNMPLFTYQEADNVLLLVKGDNGGLKAKKVKASVARSESERAQFTLYDAGTYVLSAAEINAYLKDNKNVLTFTPDANADVNPFSTTAFVAKGVAADTDHNFVYVTSKSDANAYLKVDTAANGVGIQFLKFGWTDMAKEKDFDNSLLVDQHKFLFTYRPSLDQLRIQVKQARYKSDKNAEKYWSEIDGTAKGKIYNYGDKFVYEWIKNGNNESKTGFNFRKMLSLENDANGDGQATGDYPCIRYAEILLIYAEAHTQTTGYDAATEAALNQLRDRCGMPDVPSGLSKEEGLKLIQNERRIELAGEGFRGDDMTRYSDDYWKEHMNNVPIMTPDGDTELTMKWSSRMRLKPIPQTAIDLNPLLAGDQNPGY